MKTSARACAFLLAFLPLTASAAEKSSTKEEMRALILEDAKKAAKSPQPAAPKTEKAALPAPAKTDSTAAATPAPETVPAPKPTTELEAKLPQVQVNKSKVTVLDHELHEQDRKMAFEAQNAKASELDKALNSDGATPSILGGYSTKVRTGLAQERLDLMEFEKELTEAIARAKTKEEKAELKKQLEDIRTMRRTLDRSGERSDRK